MVVIFSAQASHRLTLFIERPVVGQRNHVSGSSVDDEIDFLVHGNTNGTSNASSNGNSSNNNRGRSNAQQWRSFFNYEGHLSPLANTNVHFVIEIFATLMETAIFAYLGLFCKYVSSIFFTP